MATILIVDDSGVDRRVVGGIVQKAFECNVIYANDGEQAMAQIEQYRPDLVLTDLQMPNIDGLELTSQIRNRYPRIPVVLITAKGSEEIAAEALQKGAASYVPKHRLSDDLVDTIERVFAISESDNSSSRLMHYLVEERATFSLPNSPEMIPELVQHLQNALRSLPLGSEIQRQRVGLALREALDNAYFHGNLEIGSETLQRCVEIAQTRRFEAPYRDRRIHVEAEISREQAVFRVRDEGPGFDPSQLPQSIDVGLPEGVSGRGAILMRSIMDEVRFNEAGNEVTLVKHRAKETIEDEPMNDDSIAASVEQ